MYKKIVGLFNLKMTSQYRQLLPWSSDEFEYLKIRMIRVLKNFTYGFLKLN